MLRITPVHNGNAGLILRLEGRIAGPWVTELWKACEKLLSDGRNVQLDFSEVTFVEATGVIMLSNLQARGIGLIECSPFVAEQLKSAVK